MKILHNKKLKGVLKYLAVFLLLAVSFFTAGINTPFSVFAEETTNKTLNFDKTDPYEDIKDTIDLRQYGYDENGEEELIYLAEYSYSYDQNRAGNYGLYLYVYNPKRLIFADSQQNQVQMAVSYDGNGNVEDYGKYALKLCGFSKGPEMPEDPNDMSTWGNCRLIYKFKVVDSENSIYSRLDERSRRYDISGIELITQDSIDNGKYTADMEIDVGYTYTYSGYSMGLGYADQTESTLQSSVDEFETLALDVQHTFWRSKLSNEGAGYQNQINTVYFSVPNEFLQKYGKLQRILAQWYEYKTKDIIVTSNPEIYNALQKQIGVTIDRNLPDSYYYDDTVENPTLKRSDLLASLFFARGLFWDVYNADWGTISVGGSYLEEVYIDRVINTLYYVLPTENWSSIENYDPMADFTTSGGVSSNVLYAYILNYDKTFNTGKLDIKDGTISADLFEDDIDEYRKVDNEVGKIQKGYSYYDFDIDTDLFDILTFKDGDQSFLERLRVYGLWKTIFGHETIETSNYDIPPIMALSEEDLYGTEEEISDRLFVNIRDVNSIKTLYDAGKPSAIDPDDQGSTVFLFRFACTQYYSHKFNAKVDGVTYTNEVYTAKQSVFFDFDIIRLTFANAFGELTAIPVVAVPIDIVSPLTTPYQVPSYARWLAWIIFVLSIVVGVFLVIGIFKLVISIMSGNMHISVKIILLLPIVAVLVLIGIYVVPWIVKTITGYGGLW